MAGLTESLRRLLTWKATRSAFRRVFGNPAASPDASLILAELARFCKAREPTVKVSPQTGMVDPLAMAIGEGRREVFNRIATLANISDADIDAAIERERTYAA